jgi:hypothetical protein
MPGGIRISTGNVIEKLAMLVDLLFILLHSYYRKDDDHSENNGCHL